jgi:molybdopterin-containing oxidoreductase family membrane subunit
VKRIIYSEIKGRSPQFYALAAILLVFVLTALASAFYMEHSGHYVTGMNNQVVWGMPHVFAIFLIVAASGALNVASIGTVFGKTIYKPLGRLSGLLAIALLLGGLVVLVLDLGRPDRLIVAMTNYNLKSIFTWNIFLYVGFMVIVAAYLWLQMERRMNRFAKSAGMLAFLWRLILTTGTGSIFGFLVAREAYDSAIMAPLFIAMSFSFGLAVYILVLLAACRGSERDIGDKVVNKLGRLLGIFAALVLYFTAIQHLTNLYAAEHIGVEKFILLDGGIYTLLFWVGQVIVGGIIPMVLVFRASGDVSRNAILASTLVIIGGFAQVYVIVIGGQAYPLELFPGMEVSSSFNDGVIASYAPSLPEIGLGLGGVATGSWWRGVDRSDHPVWDEAAAFPASITGQRND